MDKAKNTNKKGKDLKMKEGSAKEEQDSLNLELQGLIKEKTKLELSLIDYQRHQQQWEGQSPAQQAGNAIRENHNELEDIKQSHKKMKKK